MKKIKIAYDKIGVTIEGIQEVISEIDDKKGSVIMFENNMQDSAYLHDDIKKLEKKRSELQVRLSAQLTKLGILNKIYFETTKL